jgi:hypothetical protein
MKQRIAVVAVSALTAGVLSVMSAPVANAASAGVAASATAGEKGVVTAATAGTVASPGTTGVIEAGGYTSWAIDWDANDDGDYTVVVVSGGTVSTSGLGTVAIDGSAWISPVAAGSTAAAQLRFTPKAAGTNMSVKVYDDANGNGVVDASEATATSYLLWNVGAAGKSGVLAPAGTLVTIVDAASTTYTGTTDTVYANQVLNGNEGRINLKLYDGLDVAFTSDTKSVTFTVKSGDCFVGATGAQTLKFYSPTTSSGTASAFTAQATTDAPTSCVIEVAVEGTVVATKTITHQGVVKTITVSDVEIADSGSSTQTGLATVRAYDAANNSIGSLTLAEGTGANAFVNSLVITNGTNSKTSFGSSSVNSGAAAGTAAATIGWTCSGLKGSASVTVKSTLATGVAVHSNTFTASCFGDAVNYSASLDKASYVPGDIAVLTITATDSSKNAANDQEAMGTASTAVVAIAGSNMTAITAPTNADTFTSGKKTYKFIVGSSEGSYQMSVDLPKFNSTTYSQAAVTAAYKIAASSATVSNADVLKSIVALIASINKQIQALQKLILARR